MSDSKQIIYGAIKDAGDGSANIVWFRENQRDLMQDLLESDESFYQNEEEPSATLEFPIDVDLIKCGFRFY